MANIASRGRRSHQHDGCDLGLGDKPTVAAIGRLTMTRRALGERDDDDGITHPSETAPPHHPGRGSLRKFRKSFFECTAPHHIIVKTETVMA